MKKRDLLKAPPASAAINTTTMGPLNMMMAVPPKGKLVIFVNENVMPAEWYKKNYKPAKFKEILLVPIRIPQGQTFGDAVRGYILGK